MGVPRPDGFFGNCDPKNKKNYRTRCSAFIKYTLEKLSELKSKTFDELETITNENFERLFFQ